MPFIALLDYQDPPPRGSGAMRHVITVDQDRRRTARPAPASRTQSLWRLPEARTPAQ